MKSKITNKTTIPELTAIVYDHLTKNGISALLVGGSVVSIYTDNKYESEDLDFISPHDHQEILEVMSKIEFTPQPKGNKNLSHPHCPITVEFPARTAIIGSAPEKVTHEVEINNVKVRMLSPTQSVMDRLAAYIAWKDVQGLDQAEWISERHQVDFEKIKRWAKVEGANEEQMKSIIKYCERGIKKFNKKP
jgi:hypothetical protein